tara:strand:+ start:2541 stop:2855 length:315 start_codon:yes stop_codon:yes gene_type:complete
MKGLRLWITAIFLTVPLLACGTVGKKFDSSKVSNIKESTTKKSEILEMFGLPFKEGEQNGQATWTYQYNHYSVIKDGRYEDLVILFDKNGVVESYRFTTSSPRE